ncbi:MAG: DUF5678 domain-containing protein [bacterium]|nr:DUF5678 domain-containing protein [bacterium]
MDKNMEWFVQADLGEYTDEYVAIARQSVISSGDDPERVYLEAEKKCPKEKVILWKVPKDEVLILLGKGKK